MVPVSALDPEPTSASAPPAPPRFKKPSELTEPPALPQAVPPPAAAAATPAAPEATPDPVARNVPSRGFFSPAAGNIYLWPDSELLAKQDNAPTGIPPQRPLFLGSVRGSYSYLSEEFRDWAGLEVAGQIDVLENATALAVWHHEQRARNGDFGILGLHAGLGNDLSLLTLVGAGNGAYFLPVTELRAELRGAAGRYRLLRWSAGGGASFWTHERRQIYAVASASFWLDQRMGFELRQQLARADSAGDDPRWNVRADVSVWRGEQGNARAELRLGVGDLPRYDPGSDWRGDPDRLTIDGALAVRYWVEPHYGFIVGAAGGTQLETYYRIGVDFGAFVEL